MEILPTTLRAKGSALSVSFTFLYNLCISKTTPLLFAAIGYKTYFFFAGKYLMPCGYHSGLLTHPIGLCALNTLGTLFFLPETQGLTLEDLDDLFKTAPYIVWAGRYRISNPARTTDG